MPPRKRRYGLETRQLSIRLARETYERLYQLIPSGQHSAFVDRATQMALRQLVAQREARQAAQVAQEVIPGGAHGAGPHARGRFGAVDDGPRVLGTEVQL